MKVTLKKLNTSKDFAETYVAVNGVVYTADYAKNLFVNIRSEIEKELSTTAYGEVINKFKYPSVKNMGKEININLRKMVDEINLAYPKTQQEKLNFAVKVFDYFAKKLNYNMLMQAERGAETEDHPYYLKGLIKNRRSLVNYRLKPVKINKQFSHENKKQKLYRQIKKRNYKLKSIVPQKSEEFLKGIYNTAVRNGGVCQEFVNTMCYLLKEYDLDVYKVITKESINDENYFHTVNLVATEINNKKEFYAFDLTGAVLRNRLTNKIDQPLRFFGRGIKYLTDHNGNSKIISIEKYNQLTKNEFVPEVEDKIIKDKLPEDIIYNAYETNEK